MDNKQSGDKPGLPPLLIEKSVTGDSNWLAFELNRDSSQHLTKLTA
ncbi:MAG: hypothetical protein ACM3RX_04050 [Methanococcaceae archaeon]